MSEISENIIVYGERLTGIEKFEKSVVEVDKIRGITQYLPKDGIHKENFLSYLFIKDVKNFSFYHSSLNELLKNLKRKDKSDIILVSKDMTDMQEEKVSFKIGVETTEDQISEWMFFKNGAHTVIKANPSMPPLWSIIHAYLIAENRKKFSEQLRAHRIKKLEILVRNQK